MVNKGVRAILWWRKTSFGVRFFYFVLLSALVASIFYIQLPNVDGFQFNSNLFFFLIINFSIVCLAVLAFVLGRNVTKLIFDRREGIFGSKLRTRLVLAFVGLTLVPTTILFFLASGLISSAMEGWFGRQVEEIVNSSIDVARDHYNSMEALSLRFGLVLKDEIEKQSLIVDRKNDFAKLIEEKRKVYGFFSLKVFRETQELIAESSSATSEIEEFREPPAQTESINAALAGQQVVSLEEEGVRQFVRVYLPLRIISNNYALLATQRVNPELSEALGGIIGSYDEYKKLSFYKTPLKSSYVLALALITGLILFSAIWFGFYTAREISVPIQKLAEGTKQVSQGNYDFHIKQIGDDEIGFLVSSFNTMTKDLKGARGEIEERRIYLETIMSSLAVGVAAVDTVNKLTLLNEFAKKLFGLDLSVDFLDRDILSVFGQEITNELRVIFESSGDDQGNRIRLRRPLKLIVNGREVQVILSAEKIKNRNGDEIGRVLIFEDVTELSLAQQMAAWREVARRIAHEIKNPLTPIKLSAQRLQKMFQGEKDRQDVIESTETIVENVESIKRLANEFSNFARMPTAEFTPSDLNSIVSDTLSHFVDAHSNVIFQFISDNNIPLVSLDQEQIRRMLINLLDNAVSAFSQESSNFSAKIVVKTSHDPKSERAVIEISDNGPGIKAINKTRIFEPYFTTKKDGSGLGLAIVNSVVSDHVGTIRLYDNVPTGARFVIELPLVPLKSQVEMGEM